MNQLLLYEHIKQCVTLHKAAEENGRHPNEASLSAIANAAVVVDTDEQTIEWVGETPELPAEYAGIINRYGCEEEIWFPEFIDCHTHLIYQGSRHHDYALRSSGKTYQEVSKSGGGILSTVRHTRNASIEELTHNALLSLERIQKYGVGTVEVKSGYGLSLESEVKILECVKHLRELTSVHLVPTFMPAHAVPEEFHGKIDDYVDTICREWIPQIAKEKLAVFFDVFIEDGYFSLREAQTLCECSRSAGLKLKLHTDQFSNLGGTTLGIEMGATSLDHLEHICEEDIARLAKSDTIAVLLPGASLFTATSYAPARKLIDSGARVALSTDFNPGTCPSRNLPLMTTLACSQMKMTIPEAIVAITVNAAAALGLEDKLGSIQKGRPFRVCQLKAESYEVLPYCFGEL